MKIGSQRKAIVKTPFRGLKDFVLGLILEGGFWLPLIHLLSAIYKHKRWRDIKDPPAELRANFSLTRLLIYLIGRLQCDNVSGTFLRTFQAILPYGGESSVQ